MILYLGTFMYSIEVLQSLSSSKCKQNSTSALSGGSFVAFANAFVLLFLLLLWSKKSSYSSSWLSFADVSFSLV
eukprot:m.159204 g.159204  ORF g.159204 m.159204 type:complete len:74 (-) comp13366_c4_seq1:2562-2783(-)